MRTAEQEQDTRELGLPANVREALGELVNAAKDGLLALSVGVGLGVHAETMEAEVDEVVDPRGKPNPDRTRCATATTVMNPPAGHLFEDSRNVVAT